MDVVQPKKEDFNFLRKYWNLILRFLKSEKCIKISEGSAQSKICRMGLSKIWNLIDSWGAKKFFWNLLACAANFSWNLKCAMGRPKSEKCIKISEGSAQSKICRMGLSKIWNLIDSWGAKKFFWNLLACAANFSWNLKCAMGRPKSEKCIKILEGNAQTKICRMDLSEIWNLMDFQGAMSIFLKSASLCNKFLMNLKCAMQF